MRIRSIIAAGIGLLIPAVSRAEAKDPFAYPLKQYGFILATALLGGLVSWYAKVRKGETQAWNLTQMIGEMATSAFAGLLMFWVCEFSNSPPLLTASLVGIAGHAGTRAITALENIGMRRWGIPHSDKDQQP